MTKPVDWWRANARPVVWIRHDSSEPTSPLRSGQRGNDLTLSPRPGETVLGKSVNSAFIGTSLETHLGGGGSETVVLVGLTTDHCVSTTARMAGNLGFVTYLVADATATFNRTGPDSREWTAQHRHGCAHRSVPGTDLCTPGSDRRTARGDAVPGM